MRRFGFLLPVLLLLPNAAYAHGGRFPLYLFVDWRYWLFIALYTLVTAKIVLWVLSAAAQRDRQEAINLNAVSKVAAWIFGIALIYQIGHHIEHVTQIFQWWYMGLPPPEAKGIIFFADLEWNHFIFDMGYFIMLCFATMIFVRKWWLSGYRIGRLGSFLLISMNLIQGWHAVEHTYRIMHHVQQGCEPCAGIADQIFRIPLIPLHFWFNVLALTFPLMAFFWLGMHQQILGAFKRKRKKEVPMNTPVVGLSPAA